MSKGDLEKLRELHERATPGPWRLEADVRAEEYHYVEYLAGWNIASDAGEVVGIEGLLPDRGPDAALIVAARNALPGLLDHLQSLEDEVARTVTAERERCARIAADLAEMIETKPKRSIPKYEAAAAWELASDAARDIAAAIRQETPDARD